MSKGDKRRGNREAKKPKTVKKTAPATADFMKGTMQPEVKKDNKK